MNRSLIFKALAFLSFILAAHAAKRPNVVFLVSEDSIAMHGSVMVLDEGARLT